MSCQACPVSPSLSPSSLTPTGSRGHWSLVGGWGAKPFPLLAPWCVPAARSVRSRVVRKGRVAGPLSRLALTGPADSARASFGFQSLFRSRVPLASVSACSRLSLVSYAPSMTKQIPKYLMALEPQNRMFAMAFWDGVVAAVCLPEVPCPEWLPALVQRREAIFMQERWPDV